MEFLYKMYNHPNFGLYLFTVITILAILFVIVLFLALKDAKKMKELEEKIDEEETVDTPQNQSFKDDIKNSFEDYSFKETEPVSDVSFTAFEDPIVPIALEETKREEISQEDDFEEVPLPTDNYRLTAEEEFTFEPVEEQEEDTFKTSIMESINLEQAEENSKPILEPIEVPSINSEFDKTIEMESVSRFENMFNTSEIPASDLEQVEEIKTVDEPVAPQAEERISLPNQFSSIYVDKAEEKKIEDVLPKKAEAPVELPQTPQVTIPEPEELPAIKGIPTPKPIKLGIDIPMPNINTKKLEDIETETYEIK